MDRIQLSILEYLPAFVKRMPEYQNYSLSLDAGIKELWDMLDGIEANQTLETLNEKGCEIYERILNIKPRADDTLESRRQRIILLMVNQLPYTLKKFKEVLSSILGDDFKVTVHYAESQVDVEIYLQGQNLLSTVQETADNMLPAHIIRNVYIRLNKWDDVAFITWDDVSKLTWDSLKNTVLH